MKKKKAKIVTHRIPYEAWANSQLSIARHYGGISVNGKNYVLDFENLQPDANGKYFPDLVTYD